MLSPRQRLPRFIITLLCACFIAAPLRAQETSADIAQLTGPQLAQKFLAARTDDERRELLRRLSPQQLTIELHRELIAAGKAAKSRVDFAQALAAFGSAQMLAERINDREGLAVALSEIAHVRYLQGDSPAALALVRQSQSIDARVQVSPLILAKILFGVGAMHFDRGDYDLAMQYYRECLSVYETGGGTKDDIASIVYGIGAIYYLKGDYDTALEYHERVLRLAQESGNQESFSFAYFGLGADYRMKGDYVSALEFYGKSLALHEKMQGTDNAFAARNMTTVLRHIGTTYFLQANYSQALNYYERCLRRDEEGKYDSGIANSLMYIGGVYRSQGRYAQALDYLRKALGLFEQLGHKREIAYTLNIIGSVYQLQNDLSGAQGYFERALALNEKIAANEAIASTLVNVANVQAALGNYDRSLSAATRAADISRRTGSPYALWSSLLVVGKSQRLLGNFAEARRALDESIKVVEAMRVHVAGGAENLELFFADKTAPYYEMIDLLAGDGRMDEAFAYAERVKARVLLDVLRGGRSDAPDILTPGEHSQEKKLKSELSTLSYELSREQSRPNPARTRLADLQSRLETARLTYAAFQTSMSAAHPELRLRRGEAQTVTARDAAALVPDAQTALIEYVVTDERTHLFVFTKSDEIKNAQPAPRIYTINIKRAELAARVERFRRQLAQRDLLFRPNARALYELLLQPAREQLSGKTRLIIVPDERLWELPFQALQPNEDSYLIEHSAVSYAPSLAVLREMKQRTQQRRPPAGQLALLALGNPALGKRTIERVNAVLMQTEGDNAPAPLPEAERQVRALAQLYGARQSRVYTGAEATEERLKREASAYRILHLATHGTLDNVNPMYSHVILAQDATTQLPLRQSGGALREDGLLQAWELMNMRLNADLVVLSACETARGEIKSGEGVIGLSWALFVAGCPTTVVSQWKVESASTTELMLNFHRQLHASFARTTGSEQANANSTQAEALRQASLALLRGDKYSHPFYWAGFVIIGDGN